MTFNVRTIDLARLNSLTKYPSIPTYHMLDPKNGGLLEEVVEFKGGVIATEKIDGTNSRIICLPDGSYILGSREELLYGRGDLIGNPAMGIINALKERAEDVVATHQDGIIVFYLEVFGGKITAASRQYTGTQQVSFRLFDVMRLPGYEALLEMDVQNISSWRDNGGQPFVAEDELQEISQRMAMQLTPRALLLDEDELPRSIAEMAAFLRENLPSSQCRLDSDAGGRPEGIVLRTSDRSTIAKARFEDYERTLKRRGNGR